MNILSFFNYRIGLDRWNFQIGALGTVGIDVGAVSGSWGALCEIPDSNPAIRDRENRDILLKAAWKALIYFLRGARVIRRTPPTRRARFRSRGRRAGRLQGERLASQPRGAD